MAFTVLEGYHAPLTNFCVATMHACLLDADHHPIRRLIDTIATSNVTVASITLSDMAVTPIEESRLTVSQLTPNSCDAEQTGLGVRDQAFRLSRLLEQSKDGVTSKFRLWVDQAEAIAMRAVERVAGKKTVIRADSFLGAQARRAR